MLPDSFTEACDRLSQVVDDVQFERLRWARTEGPMLARLEALAHGALEPREEIELVQEGASPAIIKRFVLKVHGNRVVGLALWLDAGRAMAAPELIARSRYTLASTEAICADYALVDEAWMVATMQEVFSRIQG